MIKRLWLRVLLAACIWAALLTVAAATGLLYVD
jgi:hypothetical protein